MEAYIHQRDEISNAIEEYWKWNGTLSVVVLIGDQLWFYIRKRYTYCHSITTKDPFSNSPTHNVKLTFCIVTLVWTAPLRSLWSKTLSSSCPSYHPCFQYHELILAIYQSLQPLTPAHHYYPYHLLINNQSGSIKRAIFL